jgi:hypothetical protein
MGNGGRGPRQVIYAADFSRSVILCAAKKPWGRLHGSVQAVESPERTHHQHGQAMCVRPCPWLLRAATAFVRRKGEGGCFICDRVAQCISS